MAGRALGFIATFAIPVFLARRFSQSDFGTYRQLFLLFTTLYCVAQCGIAECLYYFIPATPQLSGRYALNALLVLAVSGTILLGVMWTGQARVAVWLHNAHIIGTLPLLAGFLLIMLLSATCEIIMTARKKHLLAAITYAASDLLRAISLIVPVCLWSDLRYLLYGAIIFAALRSIATLIYIWREFNGDWIIDKDLLRAQLVYAAPFALYVIADVVQANFHFFAVASRFNAATFALYSVGCLSIPLVDILMSSTCNVMMVSMREYLLNDDLPAVAQIWGETTRKLVLVFAPLTVGLMISAQDFISLLFTERYAQSTPIFMLWTTFILLMALLTDGVLRVFAQTRFLMVLSLLKLLFIITSINWLINALQLPGAVIALLLSTGITKLMALLKIGQLMQGSITTILPWRSLVYIVMLAALAAVPVLATVWLISGHVLRLLLIAMAYPSLYMILLWCSRSLSGDEKDWFRKSMNYRWRVLHQSPPQL